MQDLQDLQDQFFSTLDSVFFASFVYPVAPEDGTGAPSPVSLLRETFLAKVCLCHEAYCYR